MVCVAAVALAAVTLAAYGAGALFDPPPQRQVAAYLDATARGDEAAALAVWQPAPYGPLGPESHVRRVGLTRELAVARAGHDHTIRTIEWWRTCCEPGIIDDPSNAGRARVFVRTSDQTGRQHDLVFEVFVKDGTWWGDAGGQTRRDWTLREVYRHGERSLRPGPAGPLTEEAALRSVRSLARIEPGTTFETKRVRLGDLKRAVGSSDFTPGADPERTVWVIAALGRIGRGIDAPPAPWAVFALDADDHIPLGIDFGETGQRPPYFARLPDLRQGQ